MRNQMMTWHQHLFHHYQYRNIQPFQSRVDGFSDAFKKTGNKTETQERDGISSGFTKKNIDRLIFKKFHYNCML